MFFCKIIEYVEYLAQLTCVDGALILNDRLLPLSFGSTLIGRPWSSNLLMGPDVNRNEMLPIKLLKWHRHKSAVNFVGSCCGSIAFVISQDGTIAGFTKRDDENIYGWLDCQGKIWEI